MLAVARHRGARRGTAVAATGHHQLGTGGEFDRCWSPARIAQFFAAAGRALRAVRHVMPCDGRAHQIKADDVVAQISAKAGGDGLGDFDRRKLDAALPEGVAGERRNRNRMRRCAIEKALDLAVSDHAVEQAGPARGFARAEQRSDQRKRAGRLHQQPGGAFGDVLPVQFGEALVEIIADQHYRQIGGARDDADTEFAQGGCELLCALHVDCLNANARALEVLFRQARRQAEASPISGDDA